MKNTLVFLSALFLIAPVSAEVYQTAPPATAAEYRGIEKQGETKDLKFIANNGICQISKKEQDDAKEYIIDPKDSSNLNLKIALTIVQLRLINNAKFNDINCGLRYFLERYYDKNGRRMDYSESGSTITSEYLKILEKLRTDPKSKGDFEKNVLNSNELSYYYGVLGNNINDYNLLEPSLARKFFAANIISKSTSRQIGQEEWQLLFDLFYSKNITPPKELNDFLKSILMKQNGYANVQLMTVYLNNANDLAYNDLFKSVFEGLGASSISNYFDSYSANPNQVKSVFLSKYLPENFKCTFARENVSKNAPKYPKDSIEELKQLKANCLNEALSDASKFIYPADGCPQIAFDKDKDHQQLLSKMSADFSRNWLDCRKKCNTGEKCLAVQEGTGIYTFLNGKFEKDLGVFKEIQTKTMGMGTMNFPLKYEYRPIGICTEKGICGEKLNCADTDITKKINEELKTAKYQSCKTDDDCFIVATGFGSCTEYAINVNLAPQMPNGMAQSMPQAKNRRFVGMGMQNFLTMRFSRIADQCGKTFNAWSCRPDSNTKVKCEKNLCVIAK